MCIRDSPPPLSGPEAGSGIQSATQSTHFHLPQAELVPEVIGQNRMEAIQFRELS